MKARVENDGNRWGHRGTWFLNAIITFPLSLLVHVTELGILDVVGLSSLGFNR
jgi:hypothetical protein